MAPRGPVLPVAVTMGEPAGIAPEITIKAWQLRQSHGVPAFYVVADPALFRSPDGPRVAEVAPEAAISTFATALPIVRLKAKVSARSLGKTDTANGPAIVESIERAVDDVRAGRAAAVVTNPINKQALYSSGFAYPGHTEFLGAIAERWTGEPVRPVMMIAGPDLRTVPVTIHIPVADVPRSLSIELIVETGRIVAHDLRVRFGIAAPRLAVAGLNPHAGEGGTIGGEDERIVRPAVAALRAAGVDAIGPLPADTMFHPEARRRYDAALCMYHDQALIPAKTLAFDEGVNVTLGLPFVRTSPDHGTALDLAGTGKARPDSLIAAIKLAAQLAAHESGR
jgi:4-hydroxythreonine-4-phosphate dehydrogenase